MMERVREENIEGFELSIDFHPFNYARLLPEELSIEKRGEIREAREKSDIKIDIHSPIVGPYAPFPDPKSGKQLFFDPLQCFELQCEVIKLAGEIGAGSVVIHMIDNSDPEKMAHGKTFIYDGLSSGALKPIIARTFPLAEIVEAHRFMESNQQIGKIVVTV